jgi:hypothetical protein
VCVCVCMCARFALIRKGVGEFIDEYLRNREEKIA